MLNFISSGFFTSISWIVRLIPSKAIEPLGAIYLIYSWGTVIVNIYEFESFSILKILTVVSI